VDLVRRRGREPLLDGGFPTQQQSVAKSVAEEGSGTDRTSHAVGYDRGDGRREAFALFRMRTTLKRGMGRVAVVNGDGLIGRLTSLDVPTALAVDGCGNVVFADVRSDRVRRLGGPCTGRVRAHPKGSSRAWWPLVPVALAAGVVGGTLVGARRRRTGVLR